MLIGARTAAWGLPYLRELQYLTCSGSQYIDLNMLPTANTYFEIKMRCELTAGGLSGQHYDTSKRFNVGVDSNLRKGFFSYAGQYDRYGSNDALPHVYAIDGVAKKAYLDGDNVMSFTTTFSGNAPIAFYVFARNRGNGSLDCALVGDAYSFKYKENGVAIIDAIPVVAKIDGIEEVCMFNKLYTADGTHGTQFYRNAGTGAFIAGPDNT